MGSTWGSNADDRWLCCLPLNHVGGLTILLRSAIYGTGGVIHDRLRRRPGRGGARRGRTRASSRSSPTQLVRLLDAGAAVDSPAAAAARRRAGARRTSSTRRWAGGDGGPDLRPDGGLLTGLHAGAGGGARSRPGRPDGRCPGSRSRSRAGRSSSAARPSLRGAFAPDGWLHTGDLGRIDDEGYLWVEGRRGDLIVTGGENVRPQRVEEALRAHPGVADVAVVGRDDREWGQMVVAVVVVEPGGPPDGRRADRPCARRLEPHEVPKLVEFADELPRTASGKLLRRLLTQPEPERPVGWRAELRNRRKRHHSAAGCD